MCQAKERNLPGSRPAHRLAPQEISARPSPLVHTSSLAVWNCCLAGDETLQGLKDQFPVFKSFQSGRVKFLEQIFSSFF